MDRGLVTLVGMTIAYVASCAGLAFAYWGWKKHLQPDAEEKEEQ
jgi:H+/gluconate symporter-like permease